MGDDTRPLEGQRVLTKEGLWVFQASHEPTMGTCMLTWPQICAGFFYITNDVADTTTIMVFRFC